ncbi:MAG TPA: MBL fold metallo-hydrolase [Rhodothermales bacterium]|nr:MBL fold metallo-hydrolase [Rhodothermales bacterium]
MIFVALGDTDAIGASCHFLKIEDTGIVLDAGADPEQEGPDSLPRFDLIRDNPDRWVDHVVITHAHHDHIGALPVLLKEFPHALVHMTRATRQLADFLLPASARLQRRRQKEGTNPYEPLFSEEELEVHGYLYLAHDLDEAFDVTGIRSKVPVKGTFYNAGHVLGAAGVLLTSERGERVFYTSDTSLRPQAILPGGDYPEGPVDVLILESTLGADEKAENTTRRTEEKRFEEAVLRVIGRGGTVLIPVFALGRAQEVLALIDRFKKRGKLAEDLPVYTAGSMRAVAEVYDQTRFITPRLDPGFQVFSVEQRRIPRSGAAKLNALAEPSIHVVSSGMMFERTLSNELAQGLVEDEKNAVLLVGFAKEDSPAHRLMEAAAQGKGTEVVLDSMVGPQPVNCDVERFRFSGHSHRRDLIRLVEMLGPKKVVLVHGETDARRWMADNIRFFYPDIEVFMPKIGEPLEL